MIHIEKFQKYVQRAIENWKQIPDSDLRLPGGVNIRYRPLKNYLSIGYETEGGVYEFPIQLKADESDSDESKATEMEVEIHDNYSVKYNAEEGVLFIRYYKLGISILLRYIKNEWELIR